MPVNRTDTWQTLAREGMTDHLDVNPICILACDELAQNGASQDLALVQD